jgi:5'-3' exonuclease
MVYSPDADVIVLCMSVSKDSKNIGPEIYLMRKSTDESQTVLFDYLNVSLTRDYMVAETGGHDGHHDGHDGHHDGNIVDYIFLTFLCGNDFVKEALFLKIRENGLDVLIDIYNKVRGENPEDGPLILITNKCYNINKVLFKKLIKELADVEQDKLKAVQRKMHRMRSNELEPIPADASVTEIIEELLKRFQHTYYVDPNHPLHEIYNKVFNAINFYDDTWIQQYNKFFFEKESCKVTRPEDFMADICENYMTSLEFCLEYYFSGIQNNDSWLWRFYYKYRTSPTFHDLLEYLDKPNENTNKSQYSGGPLSQQEQLLLILPKQSLFLIPQKFRGLDEYSLTKRGCKYYVDKILLDIVYGQKYIYSEPILPDLDLELVRDYVHDAQISSNARNQGPTFKD